MLAPPVALAGGRRSSLGSGPQPGLAEVGRVGEAGGVALDDADAGATVATTGDLLDPAVVERGHRRPLVLDEHLGELAAGAHRRPEHPLEHVGFDYIMSGHRRSTVVPCDPFGEPTEVAETPLNRPSPFVPIHISMRTTRCSLLCLVVLATGSMTACNPAQRAKMAMQDDRQRQLPRRALQERATIEKAVEAYTLLNPDTPPTEAAMVAAGFIHQESKLMDVSATGTVVAAPGTVCA